jgi:hypothetical protein
MEHLRREALAGLPGDGTLKDFNEEILKVPETLFLLCRSCRMPRLISRLSGKVASNARVAVVRPNKVGATSEKLSKQLLEYDESPLHSLTRLRSSAFSVARLRKLTARSTVDIARRGIAS